MTTEDVKFYDDPIEIACTLSEQELEQRREGTLAQVLAGVEETIELDDGYELRFPGTAEWVRQLSEFVAFERECCSFFTFEMRFEPKQGPISLRLRGPEGVKEFVREVMGS
jgi:hypothetical protein